MKTLSDRQQQIFEFLHDRIIDDEAVPSYREIGEHFGIAAPSVLQHLRAIESKGYIEIVPGMARGIRLLQRATKQPEGLPLLGEIAAGAPILAPEHIETWETIPPDFFRPRADFLYRVKGYSMQDAGILPGDLVGVHQQSEARNGEIVVARIPHVSTGEDEITLKRYFRQRNVVLLKPENSDPEYQPIEIDLNRHDEDSQERTAVIEGIFVGLIRRGTP